MGTTVGRIIEVNGLKIKAKLFELLSPYLTTNGKRESSPKINAYVKTKIGVDTIICQVDGEYSVEKEDEVDSHYLDLSVKGYLDNGTFIQGLRVLPIVSANIELLEECDLRCIYSDKNNFDLELGHDIFDESKIISVSLNKLIPSHIGVFGNTGSGKSNTIAKILSSYSDALSASTKQAAKFVVIDLNNEYGGNAICNKERKVIYKLSTRKDSEKKIPLNLDSLSEDDFVVLMNASQKTQVPVVKTAYRSMKEDHETGYYLNYLKNVIKNSRRALLNSIRHHLENYIYGLEHLKWHSTAQKYYFEVDGQKHYCENEDGEKYLDELIIKVPGDPLDRFVFELYFAIAKENENGVNIDFIMPLASRAQKLVDDFKKIFDFSGNFENLFDNKSKNIAIIQLANVNKDMKEIIPSIIATNIFKKLQEVKEDKDSISQIVSIVVDEAHNILYEGDSSKPTHATILESFEKVVKEGRKFGVFLMLASQRPSDISPTIISQLHNYFIHKLVNPSDISIIRKAVAYMDDKAMDFVTILSPGECIVSGTAFQMPLFVYVSQLEPIKRPKSENVVLFGEGGLLQCEDLENTF